MKLSQLLEKISGFDFDGPVDSEVTGIAYDSREVRPGFLFVAVRGHSMDGHDFIIDAVQNGAVALVAEEFETSMEGVSRIRVADSRKALSKIAAGFYEEPFREISLIGITGTNGKTTISYLIESIILAFNKIPGVIGTVNYRFPGSAYAAPVTTPESLDLMKMMREMVGHGVSHVIMEVSSHALAQGRTQDCPFQTAVFTNLTRDHLDYHNNMEQYFQAKSILFRGLAESSTAVINMDDPKGKKMASLTRGKLLTYGLNKAADIRADQVSIGRNGLSARLLTPVGDVIIKSCLIGRINVYNILAASATAISLGIDLETIAQGIDRLRIIPGRMEAVSNSQGLTIIVDYAHTPDALQKVLETLRSLTKGRLITVFGCGGDRDQGKRYDMGLSAGINSDIIFITSDNPRTEGPEFIINQIEEGIIKSGAARYNWPTGSEYTLPAYFVEINRKIAIQRAVEVAEKEDIILIAGKGHESYQIVGTEKRSFDDVKEAALAAA